jgi:hypothetical protein
LSIKKHPKQWSALLAVSILLAVTACNAGGSDGQNIIESDNAVLRATISYYENMQPTMTMQAEQMQATVSAMGTQVAVVSDLNRQLTSQLNDSTATRLTGNPGDTQPNSTPVDENVMPGGPTPDPNAANLSASAVEAVNQPLVSSSGLTLERVVLSRNKDGNGCALNEANSFSTTDEFIYIIATVTNFKRGVKFSTAWRGAELDQTYDWTSDYTAQRECVHFFIKPAELALIPGDFTVTFVADDLQTPPLRFTITQAQ